MRLGIDAGNSIVKVCGGGGIVSFHSAIGESRPINLHQVHGEDDMYWEYEDETGFAGSLALYESEFGGSIMGVNKAHSDTKIRVLLAVHRYCAIYNIEESDFEIVLGQPIISHNHQEKKKIKNMLIGEHTISVNGIDKTFSINRLEVAAEGATAYWSNPKSSYARMLDVGSGTVNYSTIIEGRYIDKDSDTLSFGLNTNKSNDIRSLARGISLDLSKKWNQNDPVFIVGGIAEKIQPYVKDYFPSSEVLHPIFNGQYANPIYANAVAFYNVAVNIYE
ncbi:ParM/StbA family protein [Lederbergia lenta]|uniref:ParM/StbA family protein n=1 Tax=Lederbergia lenta TaxID=1467 RepID=UPI002040C89B|nr:ParM/StbA family protein [Lederbergia lenta]